MMLNQPKTGSLLLLVPDRVSDFAGKGEVIDRYYNPGNLFDTVDVVLTNDDEPPKEAIRRMVGGATFRVHNVPTGRLAIRTLVYRPTLVKVWADRIHQLSKRIRPALIRCYGAEANAFAAAHVNDRLGTPYAISLHNVPDFHAVARPPMRQVTDRALERLIRPALRNADAVLPVYESIIPYLDRMGVERYEVAYNMLNAKALTEKQTYALSDTPRIISVGRQLPGKDPTNIISSIALLPGVRLTVVGDGPNHDALRKHAADLGLLERVEFHRKIPNDDLCRMLPTYDIFIAHNDYPGLPKAVLESLLSGLPVICNRRNGEAIPELTEDICLLVEHSPSGYAEGIKRLIQDETLRTDLGRAAFERGQAEWAPERTEAKYVEIYERILQNRDRPST